MTNTIDVSALLQEFPYMRDDTYSPPVAEPPSFGNTFQDNTDKEEDNIDLSPLSTRLEQRQESGNSTYKNRYTGFVTDILEGGAAGLSSGVSKSKPLETLTEGLRHSARFTDALDQGDTMELSTNPSAWGRFREGLHKGAVNLSRPLRAGVQVLEGVVVGAGGAAIEGVGKLPGGKVVEVPVKTVTGGISGAAQGLSRLPGRGGVDIPFTDIPLVTKKSEEEMDADPLVGLTQTAIESLVPIKGLKGAKPKASVKDFVARDLQPTSKSSGKFLSEKAQLERAVESVSSTTKDRLSDVISNKKIENAYDFMEVIRDRQKSVRESLNEIGRSADDRGLAISRDEILAAINDPDNPIKVNGQSMADVYRNLSAKEQKTINEFIADNLGEVMTFDDLSIRISKMNDETSSLYKQGKGTVLTKMKEAIAQQSRESLDNSFSRLGEEGTIKSLRRELRDLKTLEQSIVPLVRREQRKNPNLNETQKEALGSVGGADMISGILSGSTSTTARGGVLLTQKILSDIFGTPQARLRRAVNEVRPRSGVGDAVGTGISNFIKGLKGVSGANVISIPEEEDR